MRREKVSESTECPNCQSKNIVPIAYGMPGPEMWASYERGEIKLGGCVVLTPCAEWYCRACKAEFDDEGRFHGGNGES
jgi:hypothetical protein